MKEEVIQVLQQAQDAHPWAWAWLSDIIGYIERYGDSLPADIARIGPAHQGAPVRAVHNNAEADGNDGRYCEENAFDFKNTT